MKSHEQLKAQIIKLIGELFSDTTVPIETIKTALEDIIEEAQIRADSIED